MIRTVLLRELMAERGYIRGPFGSALRRPEMKIEGTPVYEQQNAIYNHREFRFFIDNNKHEELKRFTVQPGDLLISCSGTLGKITMISPYDPIGIISQALLILRVNQEKVIPEYLYYFLTSAHGQYLLLGASHGSVQVNIAKRAVVEAIKIPLPDLETQKKIADILETIDEKIELNRKMNETLEQMGQALFRNYFIDNPEVEKWEDGTVSDLVTIHSGYAFKRTDFDPNGKYGLVTIKNVQDGNFLGECSDHLADIPVKVPDYIHLETGDVLLSLTGNVGRVCIAYGENLLLNQRVAKLAGARDRHSFAYFMFRQNEFKDRLISMSRGTAQLNLSPVETKKIKMKLPPEDMLENFYSEAEPLFEMITDNYQQIQTLTTLRDTLLPRLLSGKLKV